MTHRKLQNAFLPINIDIVENNKILMAQEGAYITLTESVECYENIFKLIADVTARKIPYTHIISIIPFDIPKNPNPIKSCTKEFISNGICKKLYKVLSPSEIHVLPIQMKRFMIRECMDNCENMNTLLPFMTDPNPDVRKYVAQLTPEHDVILYLTGDESTLVRNEVLDRVWCSEKPFVFKECDHLKETILHILSRDEDSEIKCTAKRLLNRMEY